MTAKSNATTTSFNRMNESDDIIRRDSDISEDEESN